MKLAFDVRRTTSLLTSPMSARTICLNQGLPSLFLILITSIMSNVITFCLADRSQSNVLPYHMLLPTSDYM